MMPILSRSATYIQIFLIENFVEWKIFRIFAAQYQNTIWNKLKDSIMRMP